MKIIILIWVLKRKYLSNNTLVKHKAQICAYGSHQQWDINYSETYVPVVNWISVRLLLVLSHIHSLETKLINFILSFPQATLEIELCIEISYSFKWFYNN